MTELRRLRLDAGCELQGKGEGRRKEGRKAYFSAARTSSSFRDGIGRLGPSSTFLLLIRPNQIETFTTNNRREKTVNSTVFSSRDDILSYAEPYRAKPRWGLLLCKAWSFVGINCQP